MTRELTLLTWSLCVLWGSAVAADETTVAGDDAKKEDTSSAPTGVNKAHENVKDETQKIASAAGVRGAVVHGSKFGPAGCGLGSLIFDADSGFTQIFASTTNGTFGSQTFGISSGTSNCDDTDGGEASAKAFVETNRGALAKEIARGQGDGIRALAALAGCPDVDRVGRTLQQNFTLIFPDSGVSDQSVSRSVVQVLRSEPELTCHSLG